MGETGSSLESLVAWCGFGIFVGAKGLMHANILWKLVKPFQMLKYLLLNPLQNVL